MHNTLNLFSMQGKIALVTGATGHLGLEMAKALAHAGAHVLVNSRDQTRANTVATKLVDSGYSAEPAVFDVTNQEQIENFFCNWKKKLNVIVNNAYSGAGGSISTSNNTQYQHSFNVSVLAAHSIIASGLVSLRLAVLEDGDASVINIASMYGLVSPDPAMYDYPHLANPPFYGAAKAALIQLTRYAAVEFGKERIRVNSISPGPFPSLSVQRENPNFINKLNCKVPLSRIGRPEEISGAVLFLASQASSYVTGTNIAVDGGWTAW